MDTARFEILLDRHADGLANEAELQELAALLKAHPELRQEFVARTQLEVSMRDLLATQATADRPSVRVQALRPTRARRKLAKRGGVSSFSMIGIAAGLLLVAGLFAWFSQGTASSQPIAQVRAAVNAQIAGAGILSSNTELSDGAEVFTGAGGRLEFTFTDGTHVTLLASTRASVSETKTGKQIKLVSGELTASVAKQAAGRALVFETAGAKATVLGTQLRLVESGGETRLEVSEGKVRLQRNDGRAVDVGAGQSATAAAGKELVVQAIAAVATPEKAPVDPSLLSLGKNVLSEDFENGRTEGWMHGTLVSPGADGSTHALESSDDANRGAVVFSSVQLPVERLTGKSRENQWVFRYEPELILQFSYFLDGGSSLRVQGFNNEQDDNFNTQVEQVVVGRWTTAQVRLSTLKHNDTTRLAEPLRAGTTFRSLQFRSDGRLRIDNVRVAPPITHTTR